MYKHSIAWLNGQTPVQRVENKLIEAFKNKQSNQTVYGHVYSLSAHVHHMDFAMSYIREAERREGGMQGEGTLYNHLAIVIIPQNLVTLDYSAGQINTLNK